MGPLACLSLATSSQQPPPAAAAQLSAAFRICTSIFDSPASCHSLRVSHGNNVAQTLADAIEQTISGQRSQLLVFCLARQEQDAGPKRQGHYTEPLTEEMKRNRWQKANNK
eukprot:3966269-Amphidinium_carterae.1